MHPLLRYLSLILILQTGQVSCVFAQEGFFLAPQGVRPHSILFNQVDTVSASKLSDSENQDVPNAKFGNVRNVTGLQLVVLDVYQITETLSYGSKTDVAASISEADSDDVADQTPLVIAEDLPEKLYSQRWKGTLGLPIGGGGIVVQGGAEVHSDQEDITAEDYSTYVAMSYFHQLSGGDSWSVGALQASYLGEMNNIMPIGQYSWKLSSGTLSAGLIYTAEPIQQLSEGLFEPVVYPFFALQLNKGLPVEVEVVIPASISVFTLLAGRLSFELSYNLESDAYRLTEKEPWEHTIWSMEQERSFAEIGYYVGGWLHVSVGSGLIGSRSIGLFDEDRSLYSTLSAEDTDFTRIGVAIVF